MLGFDMVEPTDHLYQEGNIIGKRNRKHKKSQKDNQNNQSQNGPDDRRHRYQSGDLGSLVDVEV